MSGHELFPELVDSKLDRKDKLQSCSAIEALERQEPFVNQTLAYQALAKLARLFRYGRLSHHGGFVNLGNGRTTSLRVDQAVWQRIMRGSPLGFSASQDNAKATSECAEGRTKGRVRRWHSPSRRRVRVSTATAAGAD